jgi:hypothetical protein
MLIWLGLNSMLSIANMDLKNNQMAFIEMCEYYHKPLVILLARTNNIIPIKNIIKHLIKN